MKSASFEDFLGEGMYLVFDGTNIENTGGNNGVINPYDASCLQEISPEQLRVILLRDSITGDVSYSKYDYAKFLIANLTDAEIEEMPNSMKKSIKVFREDYAQDMERFKGDRFSDEFISLDDFCKIYETDIQRDYENYMHRLSEENAQTMTVDQVFNAGKKLESQVEFMKEVDIKDVVSAIIENGKVEIDKNGNIKGKYTSDLEK